MIWFVTRSGMPVKDTGKVLLIDSGSIPCGAAAAAAASSALVTGQDREQHRDQRHLLARPNRVGCFLHPPVRIMPRYIIAPR